MEREKHAELKAKAKEMFAKSKWRLWCHDACTLKMNMLYLCFLLFCFAAQKEMPQPVFLDLDNEWEKQVQRRRMEAGNYTKALDPYPYTK